ncbi:MAG: histidine phosphatase family protein [Paracoccaceae bacterium]
MDLRELDLTILRHCEKAGDGLSDPLTARGAADAERVADALTGEGIDAVYASPYRRSQETIAPFAARTELKVRTDARLAEWFLSDAALAEIHDHAPRIFADRDYRAPWSETAAEVWSRVSAALAEIAASGARRPVLACHGGILGATLMNLADRFRPEDWAGFHQPTLVRLHRGGWRRIALPDQGAADGREDLGEAAAHAGDAFDAGNGAVRETGA